MCVSFVLLAAARGQLAGQQESEAAGSDGIKDLCMLK